MKEYSDRVGQFDLRGWLRPDGAKELTPLHEVVAPGVTKLPGDLRAPLVKDFYRRIEQGETWEQKHDAQDWIAKEVEALRRARLDVAFDEEGIAEEAKKWAAISRSLATYAGAGSYVRQTGVDVLEPDERRTERSIYARWCCERWWRRQFRKHYTRSAESKLRDLGYVQRKRQVYASDRAVDWRRVRKARDRSLLRELVAVSDQGDQLELFGIVEKSQANPALRRAELMVRLKGFEEIGDAEGHVADFWTLTAPSAFHRVLANGQRNPLWNASCVRDAQGWLCRMWARARAKLKRLSVLFYGFRIAEPHHDGTPHWHAILFYPSQHRETVRNLIRGVWLSEYGNELGAKKYRSKVLGIDRAKGSACGYVSKYIAKNIDGFNVGDDFEAEGKQASESCDRVAAWASAHGIRQFQQLGGPQVSLWREMRRVAADQCEVGPMAEAQSAADAGEWSAFVSALGGIEVGRRGRLQLWKEQTGEVTRYDELRAPQIVGVKFNEEEKGSVCDANGRTKNALVDPSCVGDRSSIQRCIRTRVKCWRIQRKAEGCAKSPAVGDAEIASSHRQDTTGAEMWRRSARGSSSSLGPVSITVRELKSVPSHNEPVRGKEGVGWTH